MPSPPGTYLFQALLRSGLETGDLFNLVKIMVAVHKVLECIVQIKAQAHKGGVHESEDQKQI